MALAASLATLAALLLPPGADAFVYFSEQNRGTIGRATLDGSVVDRDFITGLNFPCAIDVTNNHIYWMEGNRKISRATLDGGNVQVLVGSPVFFNTACDLAVNDSHVFWAQAGESVIRRVAVTGGLVDESFVDPQAGLICGVGVNETHLFWSDETNQEIGRADINGTSVDPTFTSSDGCGMTVSGGYIYQAEPTSQIYRFDLDGSNAVLFDVALYGGIDCDVAVLGSRLYWPDFNTPRGISTAEIGPDSPLPLFGALTDPACGIAVDARLPDNDFSFAGIKRNESRGTAKLKVEVRWGGDLELAGKGIKPASTTADRASVRKLPVKATGDAARELNDEGKVKVKAKVTFSPTGGEPNTLSKRVKLIKR